MNRPNVLMVSAACLFVAAGALSQDMPGSEKRVGDYLAFQGTWIVTHNELAGNVLGGTHGRHFIFEGDRFHLDGDSGSEEFKLVESSNPREIDFISGSSVIKGIYKFDGVVLTLCTAPPGVERPKHFVTSRESKVILTRLKRVEGSGAPGT